MRTGLAGRTTPRHGRVGVEDAIGIGTKLAGALETAHRCGILHRDVKPGNVLMSDYGDPQLTDFGIAHIAGGFETASGMITGSLAYTAPEVIHARRRRLRRTRTPWQRRCFT